MSRALLLLTFLVLACTSGGAPPPDDHPPPPEDTPVPFEVFDGGGDELVVDVVASPDRVDVPDVQDAPDAHNGVDTADITPPRDVGPSVVDVVLAADVIEDIPPDVQPDLPVDTGPPPCVRDTYRCGTYMDRPWVVRCVDGAWMPWQGCGGYSLATNRNGVCPDGETVCQTCTGPDCMPMCSSDLNCLPLGYGRCRAGRCLYRGIVNCRTMDDCDAVGQGREPIQCVLNTARTEYVCAASVWCTADAMCPASWHCNAGNGHCER